MTRRHPYTIPEAAKYLGITPESILEAVRKGRIKGRLKTVKVPRRIWLLVRESVESYVVSSSHQERGQKNP
jgi:excisionase family DNA binding protein